MPKTGRDGDADHGGDHDDDHDDNRDVALWLYVTRNVTPYRAPRAAADAAPDPAASRKAARTTTPEKPSPPPAAPPAKRAPPPLRLGATAAMDKRTAQRFKRGDMSIDGRIDLHGLTTQQAHGALAAFIRRAHARGYRCVVVVTGKGDGAKGGGKIRREAPDWLGAPDLRPLILAVTPARPQHGGAGALYVLLKRTRG